MAGLPVTVLDESVALAAYRHRVPQTGQTYELGKDTNITGNLTVTGTFPSGTGGLKADGTVPLTANWDVGAFTITGTQFISDIATGTPPFVVASTTVVANLQAATVATNANLTGHVTSTGNSAILGSFTKAQLNSAISDGTVDEEPTKYLGQNLQTGTSYTLVLTDAGKMVEMNNASANTLTIPANSSVAFPVDTRIDINQHGAGLTTVVITTDTLRGDAVSVGQYKGLSLWKRTSTEWVIYGGTTA